jgi:hypothetical protein
MRNSFVLVLALFLPLQSANLNGDISGLQLNDTLTPYIIEQDIFIPEGKNVVLKAGVVFLFSPFTGFQVNGNLDIEGSESKPVIFTSIYDSNYNNRVSQQASPFDWNGITISTKSKNVKLYNFILKYSVYGIKSQNPDISILNGLFSQNGQYHFTINDKIEPVIENTPYSYNGIKISKTEVVPGGPVMSNNRMLVESSDNKPKALKYVCLAIGCAGVIAGTIGAITLNDTWQNWVETSQNPDKYQYYNRAKSKFYKRVAFTSGSAALAVIGFTGFAITIRF